MEMTTYLQNEWGRRRALVSAEHDKRDDVPDEADKADDKANDAIEHKPKESALRIGLTNRPLRTNVARAVVGRGSAEDVSLVVEDKVIATAGGPGNTPIHRSISNGFRLVARILCSLIFRCLEPDCSFLVAFYGWSLSEPRGWSLGRSAVRCLPHWLHCGEAVAVTADVSRLRPLASANEKTSFHARVSFSTPLDWQQNYPTRQNR